MRAPRSLRVAACALALAGLAGGCRSSAPLAPKKEVDTLLSDIGLRCGKAIQLETFGGHGPGVRKLDSQTAGSARRLIAIMRRDPHATYLGQSMHLVVQTVAWSTARCGLHHTSSLLSHSL